MTYQLKRELLEAHAAIEIEDTADFSTMCAYHLEGAPIPERQWTVDGAIPHENVTLLSGAGGLGKTILALMLGTALSTKKAWLGFETMQGPFLYVGAEDDEDEIHRRLDQIRSETGLGWDEFVDFHFKSLVGEDAILATFDRSSQTMKATPRLLALEDRIEELGAVSRAIDTSADVFGGMKLTAPKSGSSSACCVEFVGGDIARSYCCHIPQLRAWQAAAASVVRRRGIIVSGLGSILRWARMMTPALSSS